MQHHFGVERCAWILYELFDYSTELAAIGEKPHLSEVQLPAVFSSRDYVTKASPGRGSCSNPRVNYVASMPLYPVQTWWYFQIALNRTSREHRWTLLNLSQQVRDVAPLLQATSAHDAENKTLQSFHLRRLSSPSASRPLHGNELLWTPDANKRPCSDYQVKRAIVRALDFVQPSICVCV